MIQIKQQNPAKSTSDELAWLLAALTPNQVRYVVARQDYPTSKEAAEAIGLKPNTVYSWPDEVKRAVELLAQDIVTGALAIRRRALAKAMAIKVKGLDEVDAKLRQHVATEIIEWELGKAKQPLSGEFGVTVPELTPAQVRAAVEAVNEVEQEGKTSNETQ